MTQIIDGKYIIELDAQTSIALTGWLVFQPNTVPNVAYRISLENFIKALPIIPAVAGEYDNIADMIAAQGGQTVDVFYKVADPSDDPDYNDLKDSEIKSVYYHLVDVKTGSLTNYNSIAIPKLESDKNAKLGNSLQALTFDVKFRTAEWSSNQATLQAISNALKVSSSQDLLLDALSLKLNVDNNPTDISRVLFGLDGGLIFEPIDSAKIQSDSDATDVTMNDAYQLLLTITGNQNITNGLANIGVTAKSFSTGAIASFQPSGNNRVRANSAAHGLEEGDYFEIVNTANYNGLYEIKAVPNLNDFDFTHSDDGDETGDWEISENREIAVDLRVNAISVKEFTRQIEGLGRLNFSEQLSGLIGGEDIDIYVKSNTLGEAIEILGTSKSSQLKVISSDVIGRTNFGAEAIKTLETGVAASGTDRNLLIAAESGVVDDMIELTGLTVGDKVQLRVDTGDTITVKHNDAGATIKILLQDDLDVILDEDHPLELTLISTNLLVQSFRKVRAVPKELPLQFSSNLDNSREATFNGIIIVSALVLTAGLTSVSYEASDDDGATYDAIAGLTALNAWIVANITGDLETGTAWRLKATADFGATINLQSLTVIYTR